MKSIIMTAQNVRELIRKGTITIEQSADTMLYDVGDVVCILEPCYRLKDPTGGETDRFTYAADATAEPINYRWISPESMPIAAIRQYALITHVVEGCESTFGDVITSKEITLELVRKSVAEAKDMGLPFSTAEDQEDVSDYYTYGGDMSPEDYEKMCSNIDAERERLAEIRERRLEIEQRLSAGVANKIYSDELSQEFDVLRLEEREIVASLEAAGIRYTTGEDPELEPDNRDEPKAIQGMNSIGACQYCGQIQEVGPYLSQASADETASEVCSCPKAQAERRIRERIEDARDRVRQLFGESAEDLGFKPIPSADTLSLLEGVVALIARDAISSATVQIRGRCKAKFAITSKGKIKVTRSETRSYDLESGE